MAENRGYMQRYAMLFGTYMGGFWILKFILFPVGLSVPFYVRNDGRHACPKQHAGNGFVHRHLSGSSGDSPTTQPYRHYATDDIVQCILGFDTGFPHRLVRDETQERRRSGRVTEQQKEMLFQL